MFYKQVEDYYGASMLPLIAFAGRCARRARPTYRFVVPLDDSNHQHSIELAVTLAEDFASAKIPVKHIGRDEFVDTAIGIANSAADASAAIQDAVDAFDDDAWNDDFNSCYSTASRAGLSAVHAEGAAVAALEALGDLSVWQDPISSNTSSSSLQKMLERVRDAANTASGVPTCLYGSSDELRTRGTVFWEAMKTDFAIISGTDGVNAIEPAQFAPMWPDGEPGAWPPPLPKLSNPSVPKKSVPSRLRRILSD